MPVDPRGHPARPLQAAPGPLSPRARNSTPSTTAVRTASQPIKAASAVAKSHTNGSPQPPSADTRTSAPQSRSDRQLTRGGAVASVRTRVDSKQANQGSIFGDQTSALLEKDAKAGKDEGVGISQRPLPTDISINGNLVIDILDVDGETKIPFRVETGQLKRRSPYFDRLLSNTTFLEGRTVEQTHEQLKQQYGDIGSASNEELPHVDIEDVGAISPVKSLMPLMGDFFSLLHGKDRTAKKLPLANLANLAIVADRFDCLKEISQWADSKGHLRPQATPMSEEGHRQRILVGLLLDHSPSVAHHTAQLVLSGSRCWSYDKPPPPSEALWWDLPQGIEGELQFRRNAILETIASLIDYHVDQYASRSRQCRLGYDTSPLCDSFQLGEFVKFLVKHHALTLRSCLADTEGAEGSSRDIRDVLTALRACPSYQIEHHSHCGPRKAFVSCIDKLEAFLQASLIGVCLECWRSRGGSYSWEQHSAPPMVHVGTLSNPRGTAMLRDGHTCSGPGPDIFLAKERLWVIPPPSTPAMGFLS